MYAEVFAYSAWFSVLRRVYLMYTPCSHLVCGARHIVSTLLSSGATRNERRTPSWLVVTRGFFFRQFFNRKELVLNSVKGRDALQGIYSVKNPPSGEFTRGARAHLIFQSVYSGKETPLRNDSLRGVLLLELT